MAYCLQVSGVATLPLGCQKKRQHIMISSMQAEMTSQGQASRHANHIPRTSDIMSGMTLITQSDPDSL